MRRSRADGAVTEVAFYADDGLICSTDEAVARELMDAAVEEFGKFGMMVKAGKTKVLIMDPEARIHKRPLRVSTTTPTRRLEQSDIVDCPRCEKT